MKKLIKIRKLFAILCIISLAFIMVNIFKTYFYQGKDSKELVNSNEESLQIETEINKKILNENTLKANRLAHNISNETEIILLKESGSTLVFHDKTKENNKYLEWLIDSNICIKVYYTAMIAIERKEINVMLDNSRNIISINYDLDKIKLKSLNIDNIISETKRGLIGEIYSPDETIALTLIATDSIKNEISNDSGLLFIAQINLEEYIRNLAYSMGIFNLEIISS